MLGCGKYYEEYCKRITLASVLRTNSREAEVKNRLEGYCNKLRK